MRDEPNVFLEYAEMSKERDEMRKEAQKEREEKMEKES